MENAEDSQVEWKAWLEDELKRGKKANIYSLATAETQVEIGRSDTTRKTSVVVVKPHVRYVVHRSFLPTSGTKAQSVILQTTTDIRTPKVDQLLRLHHSPLSDVGDEEHRDEGQERRRGEANQKKPDNEDHWRTDDGDSPPKVDTNAKAKSTPTPTPTPTSTSTPQLSTIAPTAEIGWWFPQSKRQFRLLARAYVLPSEQHPYRVYFPLDLAGRPDPRPHPHDKGHEEEGEKGVGGDRLKKKGDGDVDPPTSTSRNDDDDDEQTYTSIIAGGGEEDKKDEVEASARVRAGAEINADDTPFSGKASVEPAVADNSDNSQEKMKNTQKEKEKKVERQGDHDDAKKEKDERWWEAVRVQAFNALSSALRASFARPYAPGSVLQNPAEAEDWPTELGPTVEEEEEGENEGEEEKIDRERGSEPFAGVGVGENVGGREEQEKKRALENFAVVYLDVEEVDVVDLGKIPNERYRYRRMVPGEQQQRVIWKKEVLVP
ncbi:hypothetical protein FRC17_002794 [Serendipita sp. 399]|nr:hypothetical protein FRC17_002794 [Serendipita sp. 399]